MKYTLILALLLSSINFALAQAGKNFIDSVEQTIANTKEELVKIKENYYVIRPEGLAGNVGVYIGAHWIVLVDDQWSELVPRIEELLKTVTDKPVRYVINTHFHFDHTEGNNALGQKGVTIVAHKNLRQRLLHDNTINGTFFGPIFQKAYPSNGIPKMVFNDTMKLGDGIETVEIIHFPHAHTDGDAVVHFKKADIYHMGDIFVTYGLPFIDEDNGGDIYGMIRTIDYLLSVSNSETKFIPGHGPLCTVKELASYGKLLTSIKDQVGEMIKKGLALEKIINQVNIDKNVGGIDRKIFIPQVYRMLLRNNKTSNDKN